MKTETINLRAKDGTLATAQLPVPDERFPDDESWIAPIVSCNGKFFAFTKGSFAFGGSVTPEYVEVMPVKVSQS